MRPNPRWELPLAQEERAGAGGIFLAYGVAEKELAVVRDVQMTGAPAASQRSTSVWTSRDRSL
jgi:hypothetical protein